MKSKLLTLLLSAMVAMVLWVYVVTNVSTEREQNFYGIPVVLENDTSLRDKDLMLLSGQNSTVAFALSGEMSDLDELNSSNLKVTVDLSNINEPGIHQCEYKVIYPSGVSSVSLTKRITEKVTIEVVEYAEKAVPVELVLTGTQPEELFINVDAASLSATEVRISGPKETVDQIAKAGLVILQSDLTGTYTGDMRFTLMNENNEPVVSDHINTDTGDIHVNLPVEYFKTIPLLVALTEGGGAKESNAVVQLDVEELTISGSREAVDKIESLVIYQVDLANVDTNKGLDFVADIILPENLTNHSGVTSTAGQVKLRGLRQQEFILSRDQIQMLNVPEGMEASISTLELPVQVRGIASEVSALIADQIRASIDFTGQGLGMTTLKVTLEFPEGTGLGVVGQYTVTVSLIEKVEETIPME